MNKLLVLAVALSALSVTALAAEKGGANEAARLRELSRPEAGDIVITAGGDAIWNRKMDSADDARAQGLFNVFRDSTIGFVNFEQILADGGYPQPKPISQAAPAIVDDFARAGINLVSLGNNHNMDFGVSGIATTVKTLTAHNIAFAGVGTNLAEALKPALVEKNGAKIALLSFMVTPQFPQLTDAATDTSPGSAPIHGAKIRLPDGKVVFSPWEDDVKRMETAIAAARKTADIVLVSMHIHWGGKADEVDATGKQLIARAAIKAGADAVLGHGPQTINGVEMYEGKPIFYSFGTFAWQFDFDAYRYFPEVQKLAKNLTTPPHYQSYVTRLTLAKDGKARRIEILPVQLNDKGNPHLAFGQEGDAALNTVKTLSEPLGTAVTRKSWFAVVDTAK